LITFAIKNNLNDKNQLSLNNRDKKIRDNNTTQPPLAEPSSLVKIKPVTPTTCAKTK
jgi:hypothetical protein